MNIRSPETNGIQQHLIDKAHNWRIVVTVVIRPICHFGPVFHCLHIQVIEMHIIHGTQRLANITLTAAL